MVLIRHTKVTRTTPTLWPGHGTDLHRSGFLWGIVGNLVSIGECHSATFSKDLSVAISTIGWDTNWGVGDKLSKKWMGGCRRNDPNPVGFHSTWVPSVWNKCSFSKPSSSNQLVGGNRWRESATRAAMKRRVWGHSFNFYRTMCWSRLNFFRQGNVEADWAWTSYGCLGPVGPTTASSLDFSHQYDFVIIKPHFFSR
jgi:hypothetical protein